MLSAKDEHFGWFEAVILDKNINDNKKEIKMLELMIQHGEEGKVDYNPIDRLVGVYNDVVERKLLTIAEYAKSTNEQEHEVKKRIELAGYMVEFLEYINAPKQFYIANVLRIIVDMADQKAVGILWYLFEMTDGVKQVFLSDLIIKEEERRKGYASAALIEMERDAQRNGCVESIIYVWKHNSPGINLYTKCGYVAFRELDDGMYMKKASCIL